MVMPINTFRYGWKHRPTGKSGEAVGQFFNRAEFLKKLTEYNAASSDWSYWEIDTPKTPTLADLDVPGCDFRQRIGAAVSLTTELERLLNRIDAQLDPVVQWATGLNNDELARFILMLPRGFHQTELRALLTKRQQETVAAVR